MKKTHNPRVSNSFTPEEVLTLHDAMQTAPSHLRMKKSWIGLYKKVEAMKAKADAAKAVEGQDQ
jgi:hypothetical protein